MFSNLLKIFIYLLQAIFGWIVFIPLSLIIPKKRNLIIFIGRDDGRFVDSVKYLFLYYSNNSDNLECYFLTNNKEVDKTLLSRGLSSLYFPSIRSIFKLLRANILIVDNWMWILDMKYHMLYNAKKIQIWHGIPLKKIELNDPIQLNQMNNLFYNIKNLLGGKYPTYDLIISTSEFFTKNSFKKSFKTHDTIESGYPRNDIFFKSNTVLKTVIDSEYSISTDKVTFEKVNKLKKDNHLIILYAPTFRDTGSDAVSDNILNLEELNKYANTNNIYFIFKFHPDPNFKYNFENYNNILFYDNSADIYPLLPETDLLITDYSSIYFDYLLLDKPIIFFPYDINKYTKLDRQLDYDFNEFTPGPKCYNQDELTEKINSLLLENKDTFKKDRSALTDISFKYKDGLASERINNYINNNFLKF